MRVVSLAKVLILVLTLLAGTHSAVGQACTAQNWTSGANVWASEGDLIVMLNNQSSSNKPTMPIYADDGAYNPWGFTARPTPLTQLNAVWSCPSGTHEISVAGVGRETVSFQVFITAGPSTALSGVTVGVTPLTGPGTAISSDNTQTSAVTRYLEGYIPYTNPGIPAALQANGSLPDPLIPFYDAYDSGNPAVATPLQCGNDDHAGRVGQHRHSGRSDTWDIHRNRDRLRHRRQLLDSHNPDGVERRPAGLRRRLGEFQLCGHAESMDGDVSGTF